VLRSTKVLRRRLIVLGLAFAVWSVLVPLPASAHSRPFIWPTRGRITQGFGCTGFYLEPRYRDCAHFHYGLDIANSRGTPIYASARGVVTIAGWDPWIRHDPDWMVLIKHPDGFQTMYAHLQIHLAPGIHKGAHVRQGQLLGWMGSTGRSTGPHLEWAVFLRHVPVNPLRFVGGSLRR
jgi:murein DD-endopeptidase MepM/ murein hydrolase activator NlpD